MEKENIYTISTVSRYVKIAKPLQAAAGSESLCF